MTPMSGANETRDVLERLEATRDVIRRGQQGAPQLAELWAALEELTDTAATELRVARAERDALRAEAERILRDKANLHVELDRATRDNKVLAFKARAVEQLPFCPDHRDKVAGLPCRECEIERLRPRQQNEGSTHYEGCWETRGHHDCAVAEVKRLHEKIGRIER